MLTQTHHAATQTDRQTDRQMGRQKDRDTYRQTDGRTYRQTDGESTHRYMTMSSNE